MQWRPWKLVLCSVVVGMTACGLLFEQTYLLKNYMHVLSSHNLGKQPFASESKPQHCRYDVGIIGAGGYVGSKLLQHFRTHFNEVHLSVKGYDRDLSKFHRDPELNIAEMASSDIPASELHCFSFIVYLGGLTGRHDCNSHPDDVHRENVEDIASLSQRMHKNQTLIFASTSAIAEGSGKYSFQEAFEVNTKLLDRYSHSLFIREKVLASLAELPGSPSMIGLRFGTVVGIAPSQRTDLLLMSLLRSAFTTGVLRIQGPDTYRSFLWTVDLARAVQALVTSKSVQRRFAVYHLQSFDGSIMKFGNYIAWRTGARIKMLPGGERSLGFSLNCTKFQVAYNFSFLGDVAQVVNEMMGNGSVIVGGRSPRKLFSPNGSAACVICGSTHLERALDLGEQPLANEFHGSLEAALSCTRHRLMMVTCPVCRHSQLSHFVPRAPVFEHYLYRSGTTNTLKQHFEWIADKVIQEHSGPGNPGSVLEIACNDGTQLDSFRKRGWRTYGVDPAKNLVEIALRKGHTVFAEFWGARDIPDLPKDINAIVAQNVLAHTDSPVQFMKQAAKVMNKYTKLYIQTSQCQMYQRGEFDTIYHEHISFFTAHSFHKLAEISGLSVVKFELVPIHGTSCLVTFQKSLSENVQHANSLMSAINLEKVLGLEERWYYVQYEERVIQFRRWMVGLLNQLHQSGFEIIGYGAAAKAIVMLHFLMQDPAFNAKFSRILDDSPLKQNTYCPGTSIPVQGIDYLVNVSSARTVVVVFAWNFFDEVSKRLADFAAMHQMETSLFLLRPFPVQELFRFFPMNREGQRLETVLQYVSEPADFRRPIESWDRKKVVMTTHFFNQQFLLPQFIRNHAHMFDEVTLIDHQSTDSSVDIIESQAPPSWRVIRSAEESITEDKMHEEVIAAERSMCSGCWRIVLTTNEFLIHPNLRHQLAFVDPSRSMFSVDDLWVVGPNDIPYDPDILLPAQRSEVSREWVSRYARIIHCIDGLEYNTVRHGSKQDGRIDPAEPTLPGGMIFVFSLPDILDRKLQITGLTAEKRLALQHGWNRGPTENMTLNAPGNVVDLGIIPLRTEQKRIKTFHQIWSHSISAGPELASTLQ